jgi:transcriptional regulator with XRE-family HTH domain
MPKPSKHTKGHPPTADVIAARIRSLRKGLNLTGAELERLTGLCAGAIGRLERGSQKIYASHLFRIAQATGVDVGWFYRDDDDPPRDATRQDVEIHRLLEAYMRISDPGLKHDVFELIESLAKNGKD